MVSCVLGVRTAGCVCMCGLCTFGFLASVFFDASAFANSTSIFPIFNAAGRDFWKSVPGMSSSKSGSQKKRLVFASSFLPIDNPPFFFFGPFPPLGGPLPGGPLGPPFGGPAAFFASSFFGSSFFLGSSFFFAISC
eukprot:GHVT01032926.1.p1 GENE.GHVT01032926.1~~GHVT01032926.1.p1  ORF type:complete len:136 (-),score=16.21 GHVT01032926.1:351-758(-)